MKRLMLNLAALPSQFWQEETQVLHLTAASSSTPETGLVHVPSASEGVGNLLGSTLHAEPCLALVSQLDVSTLQQEKPSVFSVALLTML